MGVERRLVELEGDPAQRGTNAHVRVCMFIWRLDQVGGAEKYVPRLARAIARLGAEVVICSPFRERAFQDDDDLSFIRLPTFDWLPRYVGGTAFLFVALLSLIRARRRYDLIHAHGLSSVALAATIAGTFLGKPVIAQAHGGGMTGDVSGLGRSWLRSLRRRLLMRVDRYVALTDQIRSELLGLGLDGRRVVKIPNAVDTSAFYPWVGGRRALRRGLGLFEEDKVIIFVGRLVPGKRVDLLIRGLRQVRERIPEARLVLVGDGPLRSELEQIVVRLGLDSSVIFVGNRPDVAAYMQASDMFVLPSEWEGLSIALLEAMACGLPVLVSDCDGNRELVTDGLDGMVFPRGNEKVLAQKIEILLLDTACAQRLARAAVEKVQSQFRLESVAARFLELYETVVGTRAVPQGVRARRHG